jgi:Na+/glutamate symporter
LKSPQLKDLREVEYEKEQAQIILLQSRIPNTDLRDLKMAKQKALSDNQRSILGFVTMAIIAVSLYMATLPEDQRPPAFVYAILGGIVVVAQLAKDQLGVRDATTAAVSKTTDASLKQFRVPSKDQL